MAGKGQREILWNAGELVAEADLNNTQRLARALLSDWSFAAQGQLTHHLGYGAGSLLRTSHLWALGDACAPYPHASTARTIRTLGGPIVQWRAGSPGVLHSGAPPASWGEDPYALVYWAEADEFQTQHDIGDASPRWDLVSIALSTVDNDAADNESRLVQDTSGNVSTGTFVKRRKVVATKTVTKGTPAGSPVFPTVPAGHVLLYAIYVPASHNAVFGYDNLWDHRVPLGSFSVDVWTREEYARGATVNAAADTLYTGAYGAVGAAGGTLAVDHVPRLQHAHASRLIGVAALVGQGCGSSNFDLGRFSPNNYGQTRVAVSTLSTQNLDTTLRGNPTSPATEFRSKQLDVTNAVAGVPVWSTGYPNGYASRPDAQANGTDDTFVALGLRWTAGAATARICGVRFHFAGGA